MLIASASLKAATVCPTWLARARLYYLEYMKTVLISVGVVIHAANVFSLRASSSQAVWLGHLWLG